MSERVLIVDDSLTVRMDLTEAFDAAGFVPRAARDVREARAVLASEHVDLIVLDVLLPDGDGVELLADLRDRPETAAIPVMMLSTEAEVRDRVRGLAVGADEYVGKPYDTADVTSRARSLLRHRESKAPDSRGAQVLVIDDSPTYAEALSARLADAGYRVVLAATGEDGLRLAGQLRPAAIVVDGHLPGIDGPTVIGRIRLDASLQTTPCILLTGSDRFADEVGALDAGADAYLQKGSSVDDVIARLSVLIRPMEAAPAMRPEASLFGPKRVLAVDDSPTFLHELAEHLREDGYDVVLATSGREALELVEVQAVDCVVLDLVMPGLSGMETCRRIKAGPLGGRVPVIILTGHDDQASMLSSIEAGADDYVAKSADYPVLRARLRAQLRRQQYEAEHRRIREALLRKEIEAAEARAAREVAETRAQMAGALARKNAELQRTNRALLDANQELDAFTYSVSHDLRAPLRSIKGFARLLREEQGAHLDETGRDYLARILRASQEMSELIAGLLELSRLSRQELTTQRTDLVPIAREILEDLRATDPARGLEARVPPELQLHGDPRLLRVLLANLLGNAWKFTRHREVARIELGAIERDSGVECYVRDNGAGFDMAQASKLFQAFQRLHGEREFEGCGIGLATVRRIVRRHGGTVRAEGRAGQGATFYFCIPGDPPATREVS